MKEIQATLYVDLFEDPLDIDWPAEGDALMHHMWIALDEKVKLKGHVYQQHRPTEEEPYFYFGYSPTSDELTSELCLVPTDTGIRIYVGITDSSSEIPAQVQPWADAIIEATKRLNQGHPDYGWYAAIGPRGTQLRGAQVLMAGATVADMTLEPATSAYLEAGEHQEVPNLYGYVQDVSFPIIVHGNSKGYSWSAASQPAAHALNRLCALLSVAFDANWRLRHAPQIQPIDRDRLPRSRNNRETGGNGDENWQREEVTVPEWCQAAWDRVAADDDLVTALHAHHQGLALEEVAPSHALLAYVGAIEGLGAKTTPLRRCDCCETCPVDVGAGRRFRNALKLALPANEVKNLADVYEQRSKTAHTGRLHGGETTSGGWPVYGVFAPRPSSEGFRYQIVWRMRKASRSLLVYYLTGSSSGC